MERHVLVERHQSTSASSAAENTIAHALEGGRALPSSFARTAGWGEVLTARTKLSRRVHAVKHARGLATPIRSDVKAIANADQGKRESALAEKLRSALAVTRA